MLPWKCSNPTVLFVNPGSHGDTRQDTLRGYLSMGTLASALRNKAFLKRFARRTVEERYILEREEDYPCFDIRVLNLSQRPRELTTGEYLQQYVTRNAIDPLMVCATATSAQLSETEDVAGGAKRIAPGALRVIGGPHVSVLPLQYLKHSDYQIACVGEGVETLAELALLASLASSNPLNNDLSCIAGIAYRDEKGNVQLNRPRRASLSMDDYPFPSDSLNLFLEDANDIQKNGNDIAYVLVGSGCPCHCVFCAQHAIHGGKVRERSAAGIFSEIAGLHAKGFRRFAMVQETFLSRRERIHEFCRLIEESGLSFQWTVEARADQLDYALLERMRDAGLAFIQAGVETGDRDLLDRLGKDIALDQVIRLREWCERLRIDTAFYMLVGLPGQDWQSILRSAVFLRDHTPYNRGTMHIPVSIAIPYPGTRIAEENSVRLTAGFTGDWPRRNPRVTVNDQGAFDGEGPTETDDMTSGELLEAFTLLDDLGHFLLHARYDASYRSEERTKARDFAGRIFTMLERRALRDLIVRAGERLTPDTRQAAYREILERDGGKEQLLRDVTRFPYPGSRTFTDFLCEVTFSNGFHTMKCLSIPNRIKWMQLCALYWDMQGREWNRLGFKRDDEREGHELDGLLGTLDGRIPAGALEDLDRGSMSDFSLEKTPFYTFLVDRTHEKPGAKQLDNLRHLGIFSKRLRK